MSYDPRSNVSSQVYIEPRRLDVKRASKEIDRAEAELPAICLRCFGASLARGTRACTAGCSQGECGSPAHGDTIHSAKISPCPKHVKARNTLAASEPDRDCAGKVSRGEQQCRNELSAHIKRVAVEVNELTNIWTDGPPRGFARPWRDVVELDEWFDL